MELYLFEEMAQVAERHWWFAARREILAALIARFDLPIPAEARIVEIGCGTGANLPMLAEFGRVWALESDAFALQRARENGADVRAGRLGDELPFPAGSAHLVCLLDVLEHVEDDVGGLKAAARLLRPQGRLLVTVPAYQWLFGAHDVAHHHFRRYTATGLKQVAAAAGLQVERAGYFNTFLFPLAVASRLMDRLLQRQGSHGSGMPPPWLNRLLYAVFAAEKSIVSRRFMPFGTSAIAILRPASAQGGAR